MLRSSIANTRITAGNCNLTQAAVRHLATLYYIFVRFRSFMPLGIRVLLGGCFTLLANCGLDPSVLLIVHEESLLMVTYVRVFNFNLNCMV